MAHDLLLTADEAPKFGIAESWLDQFEADHPGVLARKLQAVTDEMLGYFTANGAIVLPLVAWGDVTRQKVADLLVYELRSFEGLNADPEAPSDQNIILRAEAARKWGQEVGDPTGGTTDIDLEDSSSDGSVGNAAASTIVSDSQRGW